NVNEAPSSTTLQEYTPTITTALSAATIAVGGTVHDTAAITFNSTPPAGGGTVTYKLYTDSSCTTLSTTPGLNASFPFTVGSPIPNSPDVTFLTAGKFWFQASYTGDPNNGIAGPVVSPCTSEPLTVVDAKISISPNGVNAVGTPHVFTAHVQTNDGTGFTDATGATVNFSIAGGGVGALTPTSCVTGAGGTCTVTDNSS